MGNMQVRDVIEQLEQYPENWPVAYLTRKGNPVPIEIKQAQGAIDVFGEKDESLNEFHYNGTLPYVGISCWSEKKIDPYFPKIGDRPKQPDPAAGQVWKNDHGQHCMINALTLPDGTILYSGIWNCGITSQLYKTPSLVVANLMLVECISE